MMSAKTKTIAGERTQSNSAHFGWGGAYAQSTDATSVESHEQTGRTPGPWFVNAGTTNGRVSDQIYSDKDNRTPIANLIHRDGLTRAQVHANALLIAAAPELLEACKAALEHIEPGAEVYYTDGSISTPGIVTELRAAITKAEQGSAEHERGNANQKSNGRVRPAQKRKEDKGRTRKRETSTTKSE